MSDGRIRSLLSLHPKGGDYDAVVDYFRSHRILELAKESGGCLDAALLVPIPRTGPMLATATWSRESDYRRWTTNPNRVAFTPGLAALLENDPVSGDTYDVRIEITERT